MRWLWYTVTALDGEYGPHVQSHVVGRLDVSALRLSPAGGAS